MGSWILIFTLYYFPLILLKIRNFVPISLLVTLEMVKFTQGMLITFDKNLKDESYGPSSGWPSV